MQPISDDDVDRIATCLRVLAERTELMQDIFNSACRESLAAMLAAKIQEEKVAEQVIFIVDSHVICHESLW